MRKFSLSHLILLTGALCNAGCGSTKMIDGRDRPIESVAPMTIAEDTRLKTAMDWVIVRNGPGSWCTDADWDEYLLKVTNRTESAIWIASIRLTDSLGATVETSGSYKKLVKQSKQTARRYNNHDIQIKAGVGGANLMAAGSTVALGSVATAYAVLGGSLAPATAATAATVAVGGVLLVAPVLLVAGAVSSANDSKIAREITDRHTKLPHQLRSLQTETLHLFFPITPSPSQLEVVYRFDGKEYTSLVDTSTVLRGLHVAR